MKNSLSFARRVGAFAALTGATVAQAAGDSGTSSVGDMQVTGGQFMMLLGGLVGLGVVVWLVVKAMNR